MAAARAAISLLFPWFGAPTRRATPVEERTPSQSQPDLRSAARRSNWENLRISIGFAVLSSVIVTLDRDGRIVLAYRPNNEEGHRRLITKLESLMQRQRACAVHGHECHQGLFSRHLFVGQRIPLAGVAHQNGTLRFGHDPRTSVLDRNCRAHDLDNLYVVDGSFFPSSGAVNPALTIMANALRVGDHLVERLGLRQQAFAGAAQ